MSYSESLARYRNRGSRSDVGGEAISNPTDRAVSRLTARSSPVSRFATGARRATGGGATGTEVVPGPLDIWQEDNGRPGQQLGKFGTNLMGLGTAYGSQGWKPGDPAPDVVTQLRALADPANPANGGFWEFVFSGLFGVAGDVPRTVGGFIGSVIDAPFEAVGNIAGLPGSALTVGLTQGFDAPWDADIQQAYDEAVAAHPVNGLLMWQQAAKAQWNRDQAMGRHVDRGLSQHIGPAVALTDQLGFLMQWLAQPQSWISRALRQNAGEVQAGLDLIREAVNTGDASKIKDPQWQAIAAGAMSGHYGDINTTEARDQMIDQLVASGGALHDPVKEFDFPQFMGDILWSIGTDPLLLASAAVGGAGVGYKAAATAAGGRFWEAFPVAMRLGKGGVMDEVGKAAARIGGYGDDVEAAWAAMGRSATSAERIGRPTRAGSSLEVQAMREVAQMPKFAEYANDALGAVDYIERWRTVWEPALRPVVSTVRAVNDPFRLLNLNRGRSARDLIEQQADTIFSSNSSEAVIKATGSLNAHAGLVRDLERLLPGMANTYARGIGVGTANYARSFMRDFHVRELLRQYKVGGASALQPRITQTPEEVIQNLAAGARGSSIADRLESMVMQYKPSFAATEMGGAEAALLRARDGAARRLVDMGADADVAAEMVAKYGYDELALIHLSHYGHTVNEWTEVLKIAQREVRRQRAGRPGFVLRGPDPEKMTLLGDRQLTMQEAARLLKAIDAGDATTVRDAIRQYDALFLNFNERIAATETLTDVRALINDLIEQKALPSEIEDLSAAPRAIQDFAKRHPDGTFRVGFRPEGDNVWRVTQDSQGRVLGINPWIDPVGTGADVRDYNRWQVFRDQAFGNIRGSRIMADARQRLVRYTTDRWGISEGDALALFSRFVKEAGDQGITPRGLGQDSIIRIVNTTLKNDQIIETIGANNAIAALNHAFEGYVTHVGLSQKFTGGAKTLTGGQSNWLGQVAERIYPAVRFTLNPFFQTQELMEPFVLNMMRGIKPGFRASDMDKDTLLVIENLLHDSRYAYDDNREFGAAYLMGLDAAHNVVKPKTLIGRVARGVFGSINVRQIKALNYARAARRQMGDEFVRVMSVQSPDVLRTLEVLHPGWSWGDRAVSYLIEKSGLRTNADMLKPSTLGRQAPVRQEDVLSVLTHHADPSIPRFVDVPALRAAVADGSLDQDTFISNLVNAGVDRTYANNAWTTVAFPVTPDEWYEELRRITGLTKRETVELRQIHRQAAAAATMTEEQYLARYVADIPLTTDEASLIALTPAQRREAYFHEEMMDRYVAGALPDAPLAGPTKAETAIEQWRQHVRFSEREHLAIFDSDGVIRVNVPGPVWTRANAGPQGGDVSGAWVTSANVSEREMLEANDRILVHSHPTFHPFSGADLFTAMRYNVAEMVVVSPAGSYRIVRPAGGWGSTGLGSVDLNSVVAQRQLDDGVNALVTARMEVLADIPYYQQMDTLAYNTLLFDTAAHDAIDGFITEMGMKLEHIPAPLLPLDPLERHELAQRMAMFPPGKEAHLYPNIYRSDPMEATDLIGRGTDVSYEYTTREADGTFRRNYELDLSDNPEAQRAVMDRSSNFLRARVGNRLGVGITSRVRGMGDWLDPDSGELSRAINEVHNVLGPRLRTRAYAAAAGYLDRQNAVVTSRVLRSADRTTDVVDTAAGERWAIEVALPSGITSEAAATRYAGELATAVPRWGSMGSSIVRDDTGRYVVRFVDGYKEADEVVPRAQFEDLMTEEEFAAVKRATDGIDGVEVNAEKVEYDYISHDWEADPSGRSYLEAVAAIDPVLARDLAGGIRAEYDSALADAYHRADPAAFEARIAELTAAGESVPAFALPVDGIPRQWRAEPTGVTLSIPGGRARLNEGREFTVYEQELIRGFQWQMGDIYRSDPMLGLLIHRAIWKSKFRDDMVLHPRYPEHLYNTFVYGLLTGGTSLVSSEGAFGILRSMGGPQGWSDLIATQRAVADLIPDAENVSNPSVWGHAVQVHRGQEVPISTLSKAEWLEGDSTRGLAISDNQGLAAALGGRLNRIVANADDKADMSRRIMRVLDSGPRSLKPGPNATPAQLEKAAALQADVDMLTDLLRSEPTEDFLEDFVEDAVVALPGLNARRHPVRLQVNSTPISEDHVLLVRPDSKIKSASTNTNIGRAMLWLKDDVFINEGLEDFLTIHPWETRSDYGLRMAAVLPGIAAKTAFMSIEAVGPSVANHGAMDTHMVRHIMLMADSLGMLDDLLGRMVRTAKGEEAEFATNVRRAVAKVKAGELEVNFPTPEVNIIEMATGAWNEARYQAMRARVEEVVTHPQLRALYTQREVLERINSSGGRLYLWGGDYEQVEDFFYNVLRQKEIDFYRARGDERYATALESVSRAEYQWMTWDRIRSDEARTPLDPHVSASRSVSILPRGSTAQMDAVAEHRNLSGPFDVAGRTYMHQSDGLIRGMTRMARDGRAHVVATENANSRTAMHEMVHATVSPRLDDSMRNSILTAFRDTTGSKTTRWNRNVEEWWVDQYILWVRNRDTANPRLSQSFDYLGKRLNLEEGKEAAKVESAALAATRDAKIAEAQAALAATKAPLRDTRRATKAAERAYNTSASRLKRARGRLGVDTLQGRLEDAESTVAVRNDDLTVARQRLETAKVEARSAEARAKEAAGTRSAGGQRNAANAAKRRVAQAEEGVVLAREARDKAKTAASDIRRDLNAAKRRTPVAAFEEKRDAARKAYEDAARAQREAENAAEKAAADLESARALPRKAKAGEAVPDPTHPAVRDILEQIHTAPQANGLIHKDGMEVLGAPYDPTEEAAYMAAKMALSRAEENAHTLHYYRRGRSLVERSINHPYFGMYPASYMWGKVLPEVLRFMFKTPFGIDAPLGGLLLANNMYRTVLQQQLYDEEFRQFMVDKTDAFRFVALMTPSLPWEVPVNAPLWLRRTAEQSQRVATQRAEGVSEEDINDMTLGQLGRTGREMLEYAFGPAATVQVVASAVSSAFTVTNDAVSAANAQLQGLFAGGQPVVPQGATQPVPGGVVSPPTEPSQVTDYTR